MKPPPDQLSLCIQSAQRLSNDSRSVLSLHCLSIISDGVFGCTLTCLSTDSSLYINC